MKKTLNYLQKSYQDMAVFKSSYEIGAEYEEKNDHSYEASKEKSIIQFQKDLSLIQSDVDQTKKPALTWRKRGGRNERQSMH